MDLKVGERVMVYMLIRPFHGPYGVFVVTRTNAGVRLVGQPTGESIFMLLDHVGRYYLEQGDETWTGKKCHPSKKRRVCKEVPLRLIRNCLLLPQGEEQ